MERKFVLDPGQGSMFKRMSNHPKAPAYSGPLKDLNGKEHDIAIWWAKNDAGEVKKDKNGNPWLQVSLSEQRVRDDRPQQQKEEDVLF